MKVFKSLISFSSQQKGSPPDISKIGPELIRTILSKVTEMAGQGGKSVGETADMIKKIADLVGK